MARTHQGFSSVQKFVGGNRSLWFVVILIAFVTCVANGVPMYKNYGGIENIDKFNQFLPDEIKSHLIGDVYVEDDDLTQNLPYDIQNAPLKKWEDKRWPNGVVPYVLTDTGFTPREKSLIRSGLRDIERAAPCIRYVEYSEGDSRLPNTYVQVLKGQGCWSLIGRTSSGKPQKLSLNDYCINEDKGTIVHEFLHALGFYHEQARPDRDQYIRIFWDRLSNGAEPNFRITERTDDLGVSYDAISVMHYPNTAYAKKYGTVTMEWIADPTQVLGGKKLSPKDILQLNRLYCDDGVVQPTTTERPTTTTKKPTTTTEKPTTTTEKPTTTTETPTTTTTEEPITTTTEGPTTTTMEPTTTTTTEQTTTPTSPGKKACGDYSWLSCMRARPNYCSTSMKKECPRSCGVCSGPESESCANLPNKLGDNYCVDRSNRGGCRDTNFRRRYDMKTGCTKVCCQRTELNTYSGR